VFVDVKAESKTYFGFPIVTESRVDTLVQKGYHFAIGVGENKIRKSIYRKFKNLTYPNLIHPEATLGYHQAHLLKSSTGNIVAAGVRFTNSIRMGNFGIFNLNCTVGHDCIVEDFVNLAPGANISGNVEMMEGSYIGTNASVIQGVSKVDKMKIGKYATVGAGAIVTKQVLDNTTVVGISAKPLYKK